MKRRADKTLLMWLVAPVVVLAGIPLYLVWAGADEDSPVWKEGVSNLHSASELTLLTPMQPDAGDLKSDFAGCTRVCPSIRNSSFLTAMCCCLGKGRPQHVTCKTISRTHS
jgi:hypothetical protein